MTNEHIAQSLDEAMDAAGVPLSTQAEQVRNFAIGVLPVLAKNPDLAFRAGSAFVTLVCLVKGYAALGRDIPPCVVSAFIASFIPDMDE